MNLVNLVLNNIVVVNPVQLLIGGGMAVWIESFVEYLKMDWRLPGQLAPYVAGLCAFAVQFYVCVFFHIALTAVLVGAIFSTASACFWHELSTPSK